MKPNISAANIETDIHAHAFASAGAKSGEHRAPLEFPSSFPIQKRLDRITSAARNPFILRPSDASPIRDGRGEGEGEGERACARASCRVHGRFRGEVGPGAEVAISAFGSRKRRRCN